VALTLGDVAGHGVDAASQMTAIRHAVRAYANEGFSPAQVARRVDRYFEGEFATFLYLVFDSTAGELRFVNAGHLPPLMLSPEGEASFLSESPSLPLGLEQDVLFEEQTVKFPPGAIVLAYTDGLVERRTERIDLQIERLRTAVAGPAVGPGAACDRALAAFPADGGDDVALLAFQAAPVLRDAFDVPTNATALAGARQRLRGWLAGVGVDDGVASDLVLAFDEALTNAIVHSGSDRDAEVELACVNGMVRITVRDFGRWDHNPNDPDHGRGLMLLDALTDQLEVTRDDGGTTVTLSRHVPETAPTRSADREPDSVEQPA
jgi:anti-sigma regulatory factor (Ser/Thr protein kinase)